MITRILAAAAITITSLLIVPSAPAEAATEVVRMDGNQFRRGIATVKVGDSVSWRNDDPHNHSSTSDDGFWDSGTVAAGATYTRRFTSAGTFAYHCTFHANMRGKVAVAMKVRGRPSSGWNLRWATGPSDPNGRVFTIQWRRKGNRDWRTLARTIVTHEKFTASEAGKYQLRVRTKLDGMQSDWSPVETVKIS